MTGRFTEKDPERCQHYARFMSNLNITQANVIFWVLFAIVLILMCMGSLQHHKGIALTDLEKSLPSTNKSTPKRRLKIHRARLHSLSLVSICFILSIICVILECFAAFNIQYCDGEDLMNLYWGFWSVLQVGSIIAIFGVMLQFWIVLGNVETPSWAVALGTPVLIFAALGFMFRFFWKKSVGKFRSGAMEETEGVEVDVEKGVKEEGGKKCECAVNRSMSQAPTIIGNEYSNGGLARQGSLNSEADRPPSSRSPRPGNRLPRSYTEPKRSPNFWSEDVPYLFTNHEQEGGPRVGGPQDRRNQKGNPRGMMMNDL